MPSARCPSASVVGLVLSGGPSDGPCQAAGRAGLGKGAVSSEPGVWPHLCIMEHTESDVFPASQTTFQAAKSR